MILQKITVVETNMTFSCEAECQKLKILIMKYIIWKFFFLFNLLKIVAGKNMVFKLNKINDLFT